MEIKSAHIFDLTSLYQIPQQVWIIDINSPGDPLMKITYSDFKVIISDLYKNSEEFIRYNGENFYLPESIMDPLKIICKKKKVDISDLAFSLQEFNNPEVINTLPVTINTDLLTPLKNKLVSLSTISPKVVVDKYSKMMNQLEKELSDLGLEIEELYTTSSNFFDYNSDSNIYKKGYVILKYLLGFSISENQFQDPLTAYPEVNFYDTSSYTIDVLRHNLQSQFEAIYSNSDTQNQEAIQKLFSGNEISIKLNLVTNNSLQPLQVSNIKLKSPSKLMTFESFRFFRA